MNTVFNFFGGKKLFFALMIFIAATVMRFIGGWFGRELLSESGWITTTLFAAGGFGLTNVAAQAIHAFGKTPDVTSQPK